MDTSHQRLERQIEELVRAHLENCRRAAAAAVDRAFAAVMDGPRKVARQERKTPRVQSPSRSAEELARLEEQFHAAVCAAPGETMMVLAARLGIRSSCLAVPVKRLKRAGRVRIVGQRNGARYFPMTDGRGSKTKLVAVESRS